MESKIKKAAVQKAIFDKTINKYKNKDLFHEKTDKLKEMVARIG